MRAAKIYPATLLRPGDTIVEASSGNTGNAMSMVAAVKGYRMLAVMPDGMSAERLAISRAFGAQVMTVGDFHVNDALAKVAELGREPGYFAPQQFDSEWNVEENRTWLGPGRWPGGDKTGAVPCVGLYQHDRGAASSTAGTSTARWTPVMRWRGPLLPGHGGGCRSVRYRPRHELQGLPGQAVTGAGHLAAKVPGQAAGGCASGVQTRPRQIPLYGAVGPRSVE